jgi:hypothetical protein
MSGNAEDNTLPDKRVLQTFDHLADLRTVGGELLISANIIDDINIIDAGARVIRLEEGMGELQRTTRYRKVDETKMNKKNGRRRDFGSLGHLQCTIDGQEPVQDRNAVGVIETLLIMRREQIKKIRQKDSQSRRRVDPS